MQSTWTLIVNGFIIEKDQNGNKGLESFNMKVVIKSISIYKGASWNSYYTLNSFTKINKTFKLVSWIFIIKKNSKWGLHYNFMVFGLESY
jgi:hypothetical protein